MSTQTQMGQSQSGTVSPNPQLGALQASIGQRQMQGASPDVTEPAASHVLQPPQNRPRPQPAQDALRLQQQIPSSDQI